MAYPNPATSLHACLPKIYTRKDGIKRVTSLDGRLLRLGERVETHQENPRRMPEKVWSDLDKTARMHILAQDDVHSLKNVSTLNSGTFSVAFSWTTDTTTTVPVERMKHGL